MKKYSEILIEMGYFIETLEGNWYCQWCINVNGTNVLVGKNFGNNEYFDDLAEEKAEEIVKQALNNFNQEEYSEKLAEEDESASIFSGTPDWMMMGD
jgi:hypothetical protein